MGMARFKSRPKRGAATLRRGLSAQVRQAHEYGRRHMTENGGIMMTANTCGVMGYKVFLISPFRAAIV